MFPLEKIGASANIKVIGVTGSVSSGKSTLMGTLQAMGISTLSVDTILHNLYKTNVELINKIRDLLGDNILTNQMLDKKLIAEKVFNEREKLHCLEELTTPFVLDEIKRALQKMKTIAAVEVPLLFELGLEDLFDVTVFVNTKESICRNRTQLKDFDARATRNLPAEYKEQKAMFTITNNGSIADFKNCIYKMMKGIIVQ
jgi:dephospho-CoA kinase